MSFGDADVLELDPDPSSTCFDLIGVLGEPASTSRHVALQLLQMINH